jgi:DNA repair protein RadC
LSLHKTSKNRAVNALISAASNAHSPRRSRTPSINLPPPPLLDTVPPLFIKDGTDFHEAPHSTVLRCARDLARAQFRPGAPVLRDSEVLYDFVLLQLGSREREVFALVLLDVHDWLVDYVEIFEGTLDGAPIYPREVVKCALSRQAYSVVLVHNHPSGCIAPSMADRAVTKRLKDPLALVEVEVKDHLIVGEVVMSMKAMGVL